MDASELLKSAKNAQRNDDKDKDKAIEFYSEIIELFPASLEAREAKLEIQYLQKDEINKPAVTNLSDNPKNDTSSPLSVKGRFGRLSVIAWFTLYNAAFLVIDYGADQLLQIVDRPETNPAAPYAGIVILSAYVILFALLIYAFFVSAIRRCHDINIRGINSGWLLLPIANLIFVGYLMLKPGIAEPNNFGPPRITLFWEKVLGSIAAVFISLLVLAVVVVLVLSLVDPEFRQTIDWNESLS